MEEIGHTIGKIISTFFTGLTVLFFFGITGWLILLCAGYSHLQHLRQRSNPDPDPQYIQANYNPNSYYNPSVYQNQTIDGKVLSFRRIIK